ncbi:hypothetical protein ACFL20_12935, partial [Spirochaetota bacterium]
HTSKLKEADEQFKKIEKFEMDNQKDIGSFETWIFILIQKGVHLTNCFAFAEEYSKLLDTSVDKIDFPEINKAEYPWPSIYRYLGIIYFAGKQYDRGEEYFNTAIEAAELFPDKLTIRTIAIGSYMDQISLMIIKNENQQVDGHVKRLRRRFNKLLDDSKGTEMRKYLQSIREVVISEPNEKWFTEYFYLFPF